MDKKFDYIVIGSGFGGSVMSLRLIEKGYSVLLLERGRKYPMYSFPRRVDEVKEKMFWSPRDRKYGPMEILDFNNNNMMTLTASGLGGGSLIYANVLYKMPPENFNNFPENINRELLDPHYSTVISMMEASSYPLGNPLYADTTKTLRYHEAANKLKQDESMLEKPSIEMPPLAIRFKGSFLGEQSLNNQGVPQSNCIRCGECDLGCNVHAKNTLDLNYLAKAIRLGLHIETEIEVEQITQSTNGDYEIQAICHKTQQVKKYHSKKIILSAGSLGSTKLLLKSKKHGGLKNLSTKLGSKWCCNGDLLGFTLDSKKDIAATNGPVITTAIQFKYKPYDNFAHNFLIEDAGYPGWIDWFVSSKLVNAKKIYSYLKVPIYFIKDIFTRVFGLSKKTMNLSKLLSDAIDTNAPEKKLFVLLGMGRDKSDGNISLDKNEEVFVDWKLKGSQVHFDRVQDQMKNISKNLGGIFFDDPLTFTNKIVSVHSLGGCPMGTSSENGVVGSDGQVFGHPGLYVVDGSIMPVSAGVNPALTIAALAEHIASQIPAK